MEILFHRSTETGLTTQLLNTTFAFVGSEKVHVTSTIETLIGALLAYRVEMPIVVIQVNNFANALEIKGLSDILNDLFLIIVAENIEKKVMTGCLDLYPRLLIHDNNDLGVFAAVIEKHLEKTEHRNHQRNHRTRL